MAFFKTKVFVFLLAISFIIGMNTTENVSSQSFPNSEQDEIYVKLSNLTKSTGNDIVESIRAIEMGDDKTALNILSNITVNIEEIYNGLDILVDVPTKGSDYYSNN
jgi:hypothetical protein